MRLSAEVLQRTLPAFADDRRDPQYFACLSGPNQIKRDLTRHQWFATCEEAIDTPWCRISKTRNNVRHECKDLWFELPSRITKSTACSWQLEPEQATASAPTGHRRPRSPN